jgi:hypothetical protein
VVAPGQQARQILEAPDSLVNEVTFKTLGFIPGYSRQFGTIKPLSGDTFLVRGCSSSSSSGRGSGSSLRDACGAVGSIVSGSSSSCGFQHARTSKQQQAASHDNM